VRRDHAAILDDIRDTRDLTDATAAKLKAMLDDYAKAFA
jgi:F-type H+/Na+-transporting ATPase subunit alpha